MSETDWESPPGPDDENPDADYSAEPDQGIESADDFADPDGFWDADPADIPVVEGTTITDDQV